MLMTFMLIPAFLIMFMNLPLSAGLTLVTQMTLIAVSTSLLTYSFSYSYILILVMIGGMLAQFMYMKSVASNEKFKFSLTASSEFYYF